MTRGLHARLQVEALERRYALAGDFGFAHALGSTSVDFARAMAVDAAGNAYLAGEFRGSVDFDRGPGVVTLSASGTGVPDAFVAKYSPTGALVWAQQFGGGGNDWATDITLDPTGNVWVVGRYTGTIDFDNSASSASQTAVGAGGSFVLKLATDGAFRWVGSVDSPNGENLESIAVDQAGNVFLAGQFNGVGDFDPGPGTSTMTSLATFDAFLAKLNNSGGLLWSKSWGGSTTSFNGDTAVAVATDDLGNAYVTGEFLGTADLDPSATAQIVTAVGNTDMYVSKFAADGALAWARVISGSAAPRSIAVDTEENVYTTGDLQSATDFDPGAGTVNLAAANGGGDAFVSKLDTNGNYVWAVKMGGTSGNSGYAITIEQQDVYITGQIGGTNADYDPGPGVYPLTTAGSVDVFVLQLTIGGEFISATKLGGTALDRGRAIAVHRATGDVYVAGQFNGTVDFDPASTSMMRTSAGADDIFLAKLTRPSIAGRVWHDLNFDGLYSANETLIDGQALQIWSTQNAVIGDGDDLLMATLQSDEYGDFEHVFVTSFDGTYYVRFTPPARHVFSPVDVGDDDDIDSDVDPATGVAEVVSRYATGEPPWVDAGLYEVVNNPWHNATNPYDVDGLDGVAPVDVILIINALNTRGSSRLAYPLPAGQIPKFLDVDNDLALTPLDALLVINYLNTFGVGEGEAELPDRESPDAATSESAVQDAALMAVYGHWLESDSARRKSSNLK